MRISPVSISNYGYSAKKQNKLNDANHSTPSFLGNFDSGKLMQTFFMQVLPKKERGVYQKIINILRDNLFNPVIFTKNRADEFNLDHFDELAEKLKKVVTKNKEDAPYKLIEKPIISFDGYQILTQPIEIITLKSDNVPNAKLEILKTPIRGKYDELTGSYKLAVKQYKDKNTELTNDNPISGCVSYFINTRYADDRFIDDMV